MSRGEEVWGVFSAADTSGDLVLSSREWAAHLDRNSTGERSESGRMRGLCLAQLVSPASVYLVVTLLCRCGRGTRTGTAGSPSRSSATFCRRTSSPAVQVRGSQTS